MKNLKKIAALVIVLAMALSSVAFGASFSDVDENASYSEAVEVMAALDLIAGYEDGTFGPEKTITRAEFAAIIVRAIGMEDAAAGAVANTIFTDVAADNWAAGYIQIANQQGIIAGYGDGTFGPTDEVTYEQAVKMIVCALGYGIKFANVANAYPSAYLSQANTSGITVGAAGKIGEKATRATVARLVYNALDVKLMEQTGFGSEEKFEEVDKTLLSAKLNIAKVDATIEDLYFSAEKADEVGIDATNAKDIYVELADYDSYDDFDGPIKFAEGLELQRGYNCTAFIDVSEDEYVILAVVPKAGKNKTLELTGVQTENGAITNKTTYFEAKYFATNFENDDVKTVKLDSAVKVIVNKNAAVSFTDGDTTDDAWVAGDFSNITLIDSKNNDGKYDYILVSNYYSFVVEEISERRFKLSGNDFYGDNDVTLDPDSETVTFDIKDIEGNEVAFEDIAIGDVVNVFASVDGDSNTYYEVIVTDGKIEGAVDEVDGSEYIIGGEAYTISPDTSISLSASDAGLFTVDIDGKILKFELAAGNRSFGLVYNIYAEQEGGDYTPKAILYTADGEFATYDFANYITINGTRKANADLISGSSITFISTAKQIAMYVLNSNGEIAEIYYGAGINTRDDNYDIDSAADISYKESSAKLAGTGFSYFVADASVLVAHKAASLNAVKTDYSMTSNAIFNEDDTFKMDVVFNADDEIVYGIVYNAQAKVDKTTDVMYVTSTGTTTDSEGNTATKVTGYVDGELVSFKLTNNTNVYGINDIAYDDTDVTKGALIQFSGEDEAIAVRVILDGATVLGYAGSDITLAGITDVEDDVEGYLYGGRVADFERNDVVFASGTVITFNGDAAFLNKTTGAFNAKGAYGVKDVETDADYIDVGNDDYLIVYTFDGDAYAAVIIDTLGDNNN